MSRTTPSLFADTRFMPLFFARTVSVLGDGFGRVALAFGVLALPGTTPTQLSIVLACQALPVVVLILAGGVIADRYPRRNVLIAADLLAGVAWTGIAVMLITGHAPIAAVAGLAALGGIGTALAMPAHDGLVTEVVEARRRQVANGLLRVGYNLGLTLGLALAGGVVATLGARWAVAINAMSFFVAACLIALVRLPPRGCLPRNHPWAELREGWREYLSRQWLWGVAVQFALVVAALNAYAGVLGPLIANRELGGAPAWSAILVAQVAGTFLGVGVAVRMRPRRPAVVAALTTGAWALPMVLLGGRAPLVLVLLGAFLAGVSQDVFVVLWTTALQREVPGEALSRVVSWDRFGSLACAPMGLLAAGPIAARIGTHTALYGFAALVLASTGAALLVPGVRRLTAPPAG